MKIKLIFAAFAAVALLASCTNEKGVDPNTTSTKGKTAATFILNLNPTKGGLDLFPNQETSTADQTVIDATKVRLLIFSTATNLLEYNELFPPSLKATAMVEAGLKKIFVIANAPDNLTGASLDKTTFVPGVATLSDFYAKAFDATVVGATPKMPQYYGATTPRTFNIEPLHTKSSATTGLPASNNNHYTYELKAGVTNANTVAETTPAENPLAGDGIVVKQTNNAFKIALTFMVAKGRLQSDVVSHTEGATEIAKITDMKYAIHNLARFTSLVQNVTGPISAPLKQSW